MFTDILNKCSGKTITILGDIMLDHFIFGSAARLSPEAPVPVVNVNDEDDTLGGSGNVLKNLCNLGINVNAISAIGNDKSGETIMEKLDALNITLEYILTTSTIKTTNKMRIIADGQHVVRVDWDASALNKKEEIKILDSLGKSIPLSHALIISDYAKGICTDVVVCEGIESAKKENIPVFVDPKGTDWKKYSGATFITPNTKEASEIVKKPLKDDYDFETAGKQIIGKYNIKNCLITRGSEGMSLISRKENFYIHTSAKEVFDISGAGDTVIACLSAAVAGGVPIRDAVEFANKAAGIVVSHVGTVAITKEELKKP